MSNPLPLTALLLILTTASHAETLEGRVVGASDGDTLTVLVDREEVKVRLEGIDASETGQAFGTQAKSLLSSVVFGKNVAVTVMDTDRYDRKVGRVYIKHRGKARDVNVAMVERGFAWHYTAYSDDPELAEAEESARKKRRGLWRDRDPTPPWEWRRDNSSR